MDMGDTKNLYFENKEIANRMALYICDQMSQEERMRFQSYASSTFKYNAFMDKLIEVWNENYPREFITDKFLAKSTLSINSYRNPDKEISNKAISSIFPEDVATFEAYIASDLKKRIRTNTREEWSLTDQPVEKADKSAFNGIINRMSAFNSDEDMIEELRRINQAEAERAKEEVDAIIANYDSDVYDRMYDIMDEARDLFTEEEEHKMKELELLEEARDFPHEEEETEETMDDLLDMLAEEIAEEKESSNIVQINMKEKDDEDDISDIEYRCDNDVDSNVISDAHDINDGDSGIYSMEESTRVDGDITGQILDHQTVGYPSRSNDNSGLDDGETRSEEEPERNSDRNTSSEAKEENITRVNINTNDHTDNDNKRKYDSVVFWDECPIKLFSHKLTSFIKRNMNLEWDKTLCIQYVSHRDEDGNITVTRLINEPNTHTFIPRIYVEKTKEDLSSFPDITFDISDMATESELIQMVCDFITTSMPHIQPAAYIIEEANVGNSVKLCRVKYAINVNDNDIYQLTGYLNGKELEYIEFKPGMNNYDIQECIETLNTILEPLEVNTHDFEFTFMSVSLRSLITTEIETLKEIRDRSAKIMAEIEKDVRGKLDTSIYLT